MALPDGVTLVEAFPFDSNPELITDVNGYLSGDRSVDASTMQAVFKQFFSDGVFGTPANALQIGKGESGLSVTIQPGMFVINGGMGGIKEDDGPLTLTLGTGAAAGNVCYAIMLRYDNNADMRCLGFRVVKGTAEADPKPPAPDQSSENVMEYRLGYVKLSNGATNMSGATIVNEKGTGMCPYAAPFEEIDLDEIIRDAQSQASESVDAFITFLQQNWDLVNGALDGTAAGNLQKQINELQNNVLTGENLDNETIVLKPTTTSGGMNRLQVGELGIDTTRLKNKSVTLAKLADDVIEFIKDVVKPLPGRELGAYSWQELIEMANSDEIHLSELQYLIGQTVDIAVTGYGTFKFQLIGLGHDKLASGGSDNLYTFQSVDVVCAHSMKDSNMTTGGWASSDMRTFLNGDMLSKMPSDLQSVIKQVKKPYCASQGSPAQNSNDKMFIASEMEVFGTSSYGNDGTRYEYWSTHNSNSDRIKKQNNNPQVWWLRSVYGAQYYRRVGNDGTAGYGDAAYEYGCVPCFCI